MVLRQGWRRNDIATGGYVVLSETLDGHPQPAGLRWFVTKCAACHGTMQKEETKCFLCGTAVGPDRTKVTLQDRFSAAVKVALIISSLMTVASLFTDFTPSFTKCMVATVVLGLVKNSAQQMKENA
jgi:hypothetical protein